MSTIDKILELGATIFMLGLAIAGLAFCGALVWLVISIAGSIGGC